MVHPHASRVIHAVFVSAALDQVQQRQLSSFCLAGATFADARDGGNDSMLRLPSRRLS